MIKRVLMILAVLMLVLAACGPAPTPEVVERTVEVPVEQTVEVPVEKTVEVPVEVTTVVEQPVRPEDRTIVRLAYGRFINISFGPGPAPYEAIRDAVAEEYPHIDVQLNIMPDSSSAWHDSLAVWLSAQDPTIDIYGMDTPWVREFGTAGWAAPLNDQIPEFENFAPSGLDTFSHQGNRLGVPVWGSITGLFYRADLLEEYGFEPPETFDDLIEAAETITADRPELSGFIWPGSKAETLVMVWASMLHGFGGQYFEDDGSCAFNSPEGVAAVEFMKNVIDTGISPQEVTAWDSEAARTRFAEGEAVFLWHNADIVSWLDNEEKSAVVGNWGLIPTPAQPDGRHSGVTGGFAFAVNPYTDNLDAAMTVMRVIASERIQRAFAIAWGPVQYYEGLYDDPEVLEANSNADALAAVLDSALSRPPSQDYAQVSAIIQDEIHSAITGVKPVETSLNDACNRIEPLN
jgi:multiple sugar transport system substrate-binding protein